MQSSQIPRDSVVNQIKRALVTRISTGQISPGTRLLELQLAREFHTSQGPVREALRELEAMDLVSTIPYKGTYVRNVTDDELAQGYLVRASLEELAGRLAAPLLKGATEGLRETAGKIHDAAHRGDTDAYAQNDICFHRTIIESARNRFLSRAWNSLSVAIQVRFWLVQGRVEMTTIEKDHWEILGALDAGDSELSGTLLRDHVLRIMHSHTVQPAVHAAP